MYIVKEVLTEGQKVGNVFFIKDVESEGRRICQFRCFCGNIFQTRLYYVKRGATSSCGCVKRKVNITHGASTSDSKSILGYNIWIGMKARCYNPTHPSYYRYGGRGISVCHAWLSSFENFIKDIGPRPSINHSIDRIDNSKGYSKDNCRWATLNEQANNTSLNINIQYRGDTKTLANWCKYFSIDYRPAKQRFRKSNKSIEYTVAIGLIDKCREGRVHIGEKA